jgi:uncharacterized membrane protein YkgB
MKLEQLAERAERYNLPLIIISVGLYLPLGWIGIQKFTPTEAEGISPLIRNSPLIGWMYGVFGILTTTKMIGTFEWLTLLGLIAGHFKPRVGMVASIMAMVIFFVTFSFFITTPGTVTESDGVWGPSAVGEFVLKDMAFFGACMYLFTYYGRKAAAHDLVGRRSMN